MSAGWLWCWSWLNREDQESGPFVRRALPLPWPLIPSVQFVTLAGMLSVGELRYVVRGFRKSPAFTAAALAALGLGMGAATAIFSVVDAVLLKAVPFPQSDRLVVLWEQKPAGNDLKTSVAAANFLAWQQQVRSFQGMAAIRDLPLNLVAGPNGRIEPEEIKAEMVSAELFRVLGAQPVLGRAFRSEEDRPGHDGVVLLSYSLWARRFAADRAILGKKVQLGYRTYNVLGILPPRFSVLEPEVEAWVPLALETTNVHILNARILKVVARLRPGVPMEGARQELAALGKHLEETNPGLNKGYAPALYSMREQIVGRVEEPLMVIAAAVGLLLLMSCANVANLLLARGAGRQKEMAVRMALGASRGRLIRQFLMEGLVLSLAGGAVGILLAGAGVAWLARLGSDTLPGLAKASPDLRLFAFAFAVSAAAGAWFGIVPGAQVSSRRLNAALIATARGGTMSRAGRRLRNTLVVCEMAIALMVLVGAGLLLRSFMGLRSYHPGYRSEGLLTMRIPLNAGPNADAQRRVAFLTQLLDRISVLPGVRGASAVNALPLTGLDPGTTFTVAGRPELPLSEHPMAILRATTPSYFRTMGIPILAGRDFSAADTARSPSVIIIDKVLADRFWPDGPTSALGNKISIDVATAGRVAEIVGVVGSIRPNSIEPDHLTHEWATIYNPYPQTPFSTMAVAVRTAGEPRSLAPAVEREIHTLDPDRPVMNIRTMDSIADSALEAARFSTFVLAAFAAIAFILATVGIYGVMAYDVSERVHEMGIRMALGARDGHILRLVLGEAASMAACGIAIGLVAAFLAGRFLEKMLYGIKPTDVYTYAGVPLVLGAVALAASYLPSRRAMRLDPMEALRHE